MSVESSNGTPTAFTKSFQTFQFNSEFGPEVPFLEVLRAAGRAGFSAVGLDTWGF
jgi:hypothetical protein